jgi:hypothetical protein
MARNKKSETPLPSTDKKVIAEPPSAAPDVSKVKEPVSKLNQTPEEKVKQEVEHPDEALRALKQVMSGIREGTDLSKDEPMIARLVNNQEARAKVINSLVMTHDYERLLKFIEVRRSMDAFLLERARRKDVSPNEIMAIYKLISVEVEEISGRMRAQSMGNEEMLHLIQKVGWATDVTPEQLAEKFKGSSRQGREMARKVGFKLQKAANLLMNKEKDQK